MNYLFTNVNYDLMRLVKLITIEGDPDLTIFMGLFFYVIISPNPEIEFCFNYYRYGFKTMCMILCVNEHLWLK